MNVLHQFIVNGVATISGMSNKEFVHFYQDIIKATPDKLYNHYMDIALADSKAPVPVLTDLEIKAICKNYCSTRGKFKEVKGNETVTELLQVIFKGSIARKCPGEIFDSITNNR